MSKRETRSMNFSIQGEFITRLARESAFYNKPPRIPYAINMVMSCLETDELSSGERLELAIKVINGEARITGTYPGDDYGVELLDEKEGKHDLKTAIDNMAMEIERLREQNKMLIDKLNCIAENVNVYRQREINKTWRDDWGGDDDIFNEGDEMEGQINDMVRTSQIMRDYLDRMKSDSENDYGWLSPTGEFFPEDFGGHQKWAYQYIKKTWPDEFNGQRGTFGGIINAGDYLVEKGWVLLHNPSLGVAFVTQSETKPLTKAQREFLCDYYMQRGQYEKARAFLEESC